MKIKVTDGARTREHDFREGTAASEIITELGFSLPMPCGGRGTCGKCRCKVDGKEVLACKTPLFSDCEITVANPRVHVLTAGDTVENAEGAVIDIGTTTMAAALFEDGRPVKTLGIRNPQCAWGADIISRIGAKDTAPLTRAVREAEAGLLSGLGAPGPVVIVGNTAMMALYAGMDVSKMGLYPFELPSHFDIDIDGAYLPPCAGAFFGADALCSLLRSGAVERGETALVADLGTNGELALVHNGIIHMTSAAAGPALEGAGIKAGMAAADGAIRRVTDEGIETVGGAEPVGICGSGLVDAVAQMLKLGALSPDGRLAAPFELYSTGICIYQSDIRAYQLCKAAISAAAKLLLKRAGVSPDELDFCYLSGALGGGLNVENAVFTGLLPEISTEKFRFIGNGALLGGAMLIGNGENRDRLRRYAEEGKLMNLAEASDFSDMFVREMNFSL